MICEDTIAIIAPFIDIIFLDAIASQGIHDIQVTPSVRTTQS